MKTYTPEELREVIESHRKWLIGDSDGKRADLSDADLRGADLSGAVLSGADLSGADLSGADLSGAVLRDAVLRGAVLSGAVLPDTIKFEDWLREFVPALLTAGGKTLEAVLATGCWQCHTWENCPMAEAFGVKSLEEVPILYRAQARTFVQFYDAGLIPEPKA